MTDVSGRFGRAPLPSRKSKVPPLSPPFLTDEDAAYWVHNRIPANADREYGSVILLRDDGHFFASSPVPGEETSFDLGTIIDFDTLGFPAPPDGYRFAANVHSHPPIYDEMRRSYPSLDDMNLRLFINLFSDADFMGDVDGRAYFRSAYLSGPDGTLLKYTSSGSAQERSFYNWYDAGSPPGHPDGAYDVPSIINKMASVGELKVIVSNADWAHSVGRVPPGWQRGQAFATGVSGLPLMTRVCASAERAVLAALKPKGAQTSGLVLKKLNAEEYVATQARKAGLAAWEPANYFARSDDGTLSLPTGYGLEGFYFASRPDPSRFPPVQPWLYENFFTPQEMAHAIACRAKSQHLSAAGKPLSLYMQAKNASMLKYTFSGNQIEAALSIEKADGSIDDGGLQARLRAGTLRPREFVSAVILAGRLEVLRGSPLWARLGPVEINWTPFADFTWPVLSREFLSAEDAAGYAHEQIGNRRDRQFAGYIFQHDNQRFVVTEPLEGGMAALALGQFYPRDNAGRFIFPDEHVLHARYISHEALSCLDPVKVDDLKWTRQEAALSLQMISVEEMRQVLLDEIPLYLSGAQNSLVGFVPSENPFARDLDKRLGTRRHPGVLALALESGATRPQDFIRQQAAAGRLTVLANNSELWGPRGPVSPVWTIPAQPWTWSRPAQVAFGAVFSTADDAAQDRYSRDTRLHDTERAWFGFILKHQDKEAYVATELFPVLEQRNNVFQLQSMFGPRRTPPWYQFPEGFNRHAHFYSRQRVKHPANGPDSWLGQYFIAPDDIAIAAYYSRRRPVTEPDQPIALYMSTQDGALLSYSKSKASKLFDDGTPALTLDAIKRNLARGKLLPADFVRLVANSGELNVLRTTLCWDRPGPVTASWQAFANLQRRELSPVFRSADDAASFARSRLPAVVLKTYGGLILQRSDSLYVATAPIEVSQEDFDVTEIYPEESRNSGLFPAGCRITARYRSRVVRGLSVLLSDIEKQTYQNMLSVDTLYSAFTRVSGRVSQEYLFAPDGSLVRYQSGLWARLRADLANALTASKTLPADLDGKKIKQFIRSGELKPSAWVDSLTKAGHLQVVTGSRLWGLPRLVSRWQPFSADRLPVTDYTRASSAPVCSPVFIQADAAARNVHEASVSRDSPTFGFILRSRDGLFIASLPVEVQRSLLGLDRVFEQGRLPAGFMLDSIYLRAPLPPLGALDNDFRHFFISPTDVQQACARANTPQGYKPIYFSCADGALLRLALHPFEPGAFYDEFGQIQLRPNSFASPLQTANDERDIAKGTFDFPDYVRRMARAGILEVIETSAWWSRHGVADEGWQPHMVEVSSNERWKANPVPALGPVFHHGDDAARHAQARAGKEPIIDTGYEGAILARLPSRRFVPLEPVSYSAYDDSPLARIFRAANDPSSNWRNPAPRYPDGYTLVASHQFHLSGNTTLGPDKEKVYANFASPALVHAHTHELKNKGFDIQSYYYSTPNGVLLQYIPVYTPAEKALLLTRSVVFENGRWVSRLTPDEFVSRLMELGEFRVLVAGHYWRQTGRMGNTWRTRRQQPPSLGIVRIKDEL
ncbi:DUF4329 domain-containing protein [Pseudomonas sp. A34-9]|uniref:DUF4329 domain-containing protein n=1 Tax=Pseudomonas sp. A34-9 TaxID=3034675 RepID=UPI00240E870E|nr:DUF4329 domain-containing protein [Pseudomonas sp. A34-9]